ncbi:MAG: hypothetical protein H6858_09640 [Rhodospirillales bacterium]|nr:hypothetical protein [Alphaproteobacteria bacterium]MCB9977082.1 hypothetical protein [Rhodospirillales bacterium]MCB9977848.1 hypothetical protein [Rhodospirillales bacterium]
MRKLLILIIAFLPLIAAAGHDGYQYYKNPEKGLLLSDIGWLWNKYDPESHKMVNQEINTLIQEAQQNQEPDTIAVPIEQPAQAGQEGGDGTEIDDGTAKIKVIVHKKDSDLPKTAEVMGEAADFASFLMKQKAVYVAGIFAVVMLLLMWILGSVKGSIGKKRDMDDMDPLYQRKKGTYKYSRK